MARTSPVHYIAPSAISITPNANNSSRDLAVYVAKGAKIKVYSPGITDLDIDKSTNTWQEWTFAGKNRRLNGGDGPYTIYVRLSKSDKTKGYLVFAAKVADGDKWKDKYAYVTRTGLATGTVNSNDNTYWWIKLGDVSVPDNGQRTVTLDTGILGTDQYNEDWVQNPDDLPLRVELGCTIGDEDAGQTPYIYWDDSLVLTATLMEGWGTAVTDRLDHWSISRNTGDPVADAAWHGAIGAGGSITLTHVHGSGDDFNGAVSAVFTVTAWEKAESWTQEVPVYEEMASASINILAEISEKYELVLSSDSIAYDPRTQTYSPSTGIDVSIRNIDQRGDMREITKDELDAASLSVSYATVDSGSWTPLVYSGSGSAIASANIATTAFTNQQSLNVRLCRTIPSTDGVSPAETVELNRRTIACISDGENGRGVTGIAFAYRISSSGYVRPEGEYSPSMPDTTQHKGEYLWTRRTVSYTYGNDDVSYYSTYIPEDGRSITGENAVYIDLDNQADIVACDASGVVRYNQTVTLHASIYDGSTVAQSATDATTDSLVIGGATPSVTLSGGVLTVQWAFTPSHTISSNVEKTIKMRYNGETYAAVFRLAVANTDVIYQLKPSVDSVSFRRQSDNTLTPNSVSVSCGYTKTTPDGCQVFDGSVAANTYGIGGTYNIFYRFKQADGTFLDWAWAKDQPTISISKDTAYIGVEYALSNADAYRDVSDANIFDREMIPIVKDGTNGADGTSPWIADIDNEMDSVACDVDGKPVQVSGRDQSVSTSFSLFYGSAVKNYKVTQIVRTYGGGSTATYTSNSTLNNVTVSLSSGFNTAARTNVLTVTYNANSSISGKDDFAVTLQADDSASIMRELHFTVNGVRPGADGKDAVLFSLVPSVNEVVKKKDGTYVPAGTSYVTCSVKKTVGGTTTDASASEYTLKYSLNGSTENPYPLAGIQVSTIDTNLVFVLYNAAGTVLLDRETIPLISDGTDGEAGKDAHEVNPNILLRTMFDKGWDFVAEKWEANHDYVGIDTDDDRTVDGKKSVLINATNASSFVDFKQNVQESIKTGTWYTLSFYSFQSQAWNSFFYSGDNTKPCIDTSAGVYVDGEYRSSITADGNVQWSASPQGARHVFTFKTNSSFQTETCLIIFRAQQGGTVSVCMPKLETGQYATAYMPNEDDLKGIDGLNAVEYDLEPLVEQALVKRDKKLYVSLSYKLRRQDGSATTYPDYGNDFNVYYQASNAATATAFANGDYSGNVATKELPATDYDFTTSPTYYSVILKYQGTEIRRRIVMVQMETKTVFEVTDEAIRSSVKAIEGVKNYFGFNRGAYNDKYNGSETCQLYPYGYGVACWGASNIIRNLGTTSDDNGSTWTLAFEAKRATSTVTKITPMLCGNHSANTINGAGGGQITLGTDWMKYVCVWNASISELSEFSNGGYLNFQRDSGSQFYVRNITLIKGVFSNLGFVKAQEDLDYAGSTQPFTWLVMSSSTKDGNFMGMDVYKNRQTLQQSGSTFIDMIGYNDFEIENKTPYTLSFWAKSDVNGAKIGSYCYNTAWNLTKDFGDLENMTRKDALWITTLTTDWKRYTVHWFPNVDAITGSDSTKKKIKNIIACRFASDFTSLNNTATVYIAGMTFQEGWVENGTSTVMQSVSSINQTAKSISLQVENIGQEMSELQLEAGKISSKIYVGNNNLVMNGAFKTDAEFWHAWGSPTTREIVTIDGKKWMHVVSTTAQYQGYDQNMYSDYGITVDGGEKYTFSMLARGAASDTVVCVGFHWYDKNSPTTRLGTQTWYDFTPGTTAKKFTQSFTIPADAGSFTIMVGERVSNKVQEFYITDIKLEKGNMATEWTPSPQEESAHVASSITQTANEIRAEVGECGVDITNKNITLRGDTNIIGSLTLDSDQQGFLLNGNGGTAQISPQSIGQYSQFIGRTKVSSYMSKQAINTLAEAATYYQGTFQSTSTFGEVASGATITINNQSLTFRPLNSGNVITPQSGSVSTIYTINVGSESRSFTVSGTSSQEISWNGHSGGSVTVDVLTTARFNKSDFPSSGGIQSSATAICTQTFKIEYPKVGVFSLLGYDGFAINFGNNKSVYFGAEGAYLKYGDYALRVTANSGIEKSYGSTSGGVQQWVGINNLKVHTITGSSDYTVDNGVDFIVCKNTGNIVITLPTPTKDNVVQPMIGRKIYIRRYTNKTITVTSSSSSGADVIVDILQESSRSHSVNVQEALNVFICDGTYWFRGWLGN